jgi:hypothetical protein
MIKAADSLMDIATNGTLWSSPQGKRIMKVLDELDPREPAPVSPLGAAEDWCSSWRDEDERKLIQEILGLQGTIHSFDSASGTGTRLDLSSTSHSCPHRREEFLRAIETASEKIKQMRLDRSIKHALHNSNRYSTVHSGCP